MHQLRILTFPIATILFHRVPGWGVPEWHLLRFLQPPTLPNEIAWMRLISCDIFFAIAGRDWFTTAFQILALRSLNEPVRDFG